MHVFVTGATGWVGSAVVADLIAAGHRVTGLCRNPEKAGAIAAAGAHVLPGTLDDLDILGGAAASADAVIHTAFNHDFSRFAENAEQDRRAIAAIGAALAGSDRPLVVTSGLLGLPRGASEAVTPDASLPRKSEAAARTLAESGVRVACVRLAPSVHGVGDRHGFVPRLIQLARETGVSAYLDAGETCWSGVHRQDAARVFRLAVEHGATDPVYHAVADESVPFLHLAAAIGRALGLPVESREAAHFGWFAMMVGADMAVSSAQTRARLGWEPTGPSLLDDIAHGGYFQPNQISAR